MTESEIKKLNEIIQKMPGNAKARLALGKAYLATGKIKEAKDEIEKSIELEPDNPEALFKLGNVFAELREFNEAINYYKKSLTFDSYYVDAIYCLGMAYVETKNEIEYKKITERLEQLHPVWAQALKNYSKKIEV